MVEAIEYGYRSLRTAVTQAETRRLKYQLDEGYAYFRRELPLYKTLPDGHKIIKDVLTDGQERDQHIYATGSKGIWKVNVVDKEGIFNRASLYPSDSLQQLAKELTARQRFIKPNMFDCREQRHTSVQLFIAANARCIVEDILCNMGAAPPTHVAPFFVELDHRPDLVLLTPEPVIIEIGRASKFGKTQQYVQDFNRQFPYVKNVSGVVVHYKDCEKGGNITIYGSNPMEKQKMEQ
jgi:hypothetical protein